MTIQTIVDEALRTGSLTNRQVMTLNARLRRRQYSEELLLALDTLVKALLAGSVVAESTLLDLTLLSVA